MAGFNQRGPMGQGPMTGRKMGRCTNFGANNQNDISPINENTNQNVPAGGFGRGRGLGRGQGGLGMGMGRRFRHGNNF